MAISHDGRWVAVSNHFSHSVFVYEHSSLGDDAEPVAILRGATHPHGLRFTADGERLATPIARLARELAAASAHAELLEAELAAIKATRAWRLLEPARNAYGTVRRRTARR